MSSYTIYIDCITQETVLELGSGEPRDIIIPGMLFGVKSKTERLLLTLLRCGILSQKEYDEKMIGYEDDEDDHLLDNFGLWELKNFTEDQLKKYLELYTEHMKFLRPDRLSEPKIDELKEYLIRNFPHLTPYGGTSLYLAEDKSLPHGSIVFADTRASPDPPTFLFMEFGLLADTVQLDSEEKEEDEACGSHSAPEVDYSTTELSDSMKSLRLDNEIMAA